MRSYKSIAILVGIIIVVLAAAAAIFVFKAEIMEFMADLKKKFGAKFRRDGEFEDFEEV